MATIANLVVQISADMASMKATLEQSQARLQSLESQAGKTNQIMGTLGRTLVGAFSVHQLVQFGRELLADADAMVRLSDKTGMTITALQGLKYAANQSGVQIETVSSAVSMMQKRLASGNDSALGALRSLHVSFADIRNMSPDRQFIAIADAVGQVQDPMMRAKIATDLFGKGGAEVLPLLIANVQELTDKAPKMAETAVRAFDDIGDSLGRLWLGFKSWVGNVLAANLEPLQNAAMAIRALRGEAEQAPKVGAKPVWEQPLFSWMPGGGFEAGATDREIRELEAATDALLRRTREQTAAVKTQAPAVQQLTLEWTDYSDALTRAYLQEWTTTHQMETATLRIKEWPEITEVAIEKTDEWREELTRLSSAFRMLAQTSGTSGLGAFATQAANVAGAMDLGYTAGQQFVGHMKLVDGTAKSSAKGIAGMALATMQMAAAMDQATQSTDHWANAVSGAMTGASIGMGVGGPYGAAAGAGIGFLYGYTKDVTADDVTQDMIDQWTAQHGGYEQMVRDLQLAGAELWAFRQAVDAGANDLERYQSAVKAVNHTLESWKKTLDSLKSAAVGTQTLADALGVTTTQTQFERLGLYVSAIFGKMLRESGSLAEALGLVSDALDKMLAASQQYGFPVGGALGQLLGLRGVTTSNADLMQRITGLGQIGQGLGPHLMGSMGLVPTFGADLEETFRQLLGRGVGRDQAMLLMQGPMQQLWQAARSPQMQRALDPSVLALLREFETAGFVGPDMLSVAERQLDVLGQIRDLLAGVSPETGYAPGMGGTAPGIRGGGTRGRDRDLYGFASGTDGFQWFGSGTPAMLHGWEAVVPLSRLEGLYGRDVAGGGGGGGGSLTVSVPVYLDGRKIAENQVRHLPGSVKRYGVH